MAFDVLQYGDEVLIDRPNAERRSILESVELQGPFWCTPPSYVGDGRSLLSADLAGVRAPRPRDAATPCGLELVEIRR
jgi:hypothetical protein